MNEPATQFETSAGQMEDLREEVQFLRLLLCVSLILMMVFGACVDGFLLKQVSDVRSLAATLEPQWKAIEVNEPAQLAKAAQLWSYLNEYTKTHPDLAQILSGVRPYFSQTLLNPAYAPKKI